jgi:hypothetical protein
MRYLKNNFTGARGERIPHDWLNTIANFWNDLAVVGGALLRRSDGRDTVIELTAETTTDTDGYDTDKNPDGRQTVQHNPEDYSDDDDSHASEIQLHNVHLTKEGSNSIPFFVSEDSKQGKDSDKIVGELYWATPDSDRKEDDGEKIYRSLDIADTHETDDKGKHSLSLYGFTGADVSSVGYVKKVTSTAGDGKELEWRHPVTWESDPKDDTAGSDDCVVYIEEGVVQAGTSYATLTYTKRILTVDKAALDVGAESEELEAILPVTIDPESIPATPSDEIIHNQLDGTNSPDFPEWGESNNGHDRRYLRINASWTGDSYNNTTNGIAHDISGTNAINFTTGELSGTPGQVTVDYADRKLWTYTDGQVETLDWNTRTLTAASTSEPWKATRAFRITADGNENKYVDFLVTDGKLEIKDQDGATLALFEKVT